MTSRSSVWRRRRARRLMLVHGLAVASVVALLAIAVGAGADTGRHRDEKLPPRSLDGSGNNRAHPTWGRAATNYVRVAPATYADGVAEVVDGPNARYISNRIFNDIGQNLFSERNVSQWGWAWGQFIDHDMGLRDETPAEDAAIEFDQHDPLESFTDDFGALAFNRTPAAPRTGITSPREQVNTLSSYLDGSQIYGVTAERLDWLRAGRANGDPDDNDASLLLPGGYLPLVSARGNAATAPKMDLMGPLAGQPEKARVAGDVRANENIALTSIQTLFAREHNRIVAELPRRLSENLKFEVARRVVAAEIQYITYNDFLPALGVKLEKYDGYDRRVNAGLTSEFATAGFRAHSMVHGEFEVAYQDDDYTAAQVAAFEAVGIETEDEGDENVLVIPLSVAFGNPDLLPEVGLDKALASLSAERQYRNDEQIDNSMRSVLFEVPKPGTTDPGACQTPVVDPRCFSGVADLAALDIQRSRDHGIESYNDMRAAYGLKRKHSFTAITGEPTDRLGHYKIDDPRILDFTELRDRDGHVVTPGSPDAEANAVTGIRRTTTAARLKAIYHDVDAVDAFVGMAAEPHVDGTEFGELQLAIWTDQFRRLRDGDRFFYENDPVLKAISLYLGVSYRHSLADVIRSNTTGGDLAIAPDVFTVSPAEETAVVPPTVTTTPPTNPTTPTRPTTPPTDTTATTGPPAGGGRCVVADGDGWKSVPCPSGP